MSSDAMIWAWKQASKLSPGCLNVLLRMAWKHQNDVMVISVSALSRDLCLQRLTVRKHLKTLNALGLITLDGGAPNRMKRVLLRLDADCEDGQKVTMLPAKGGGQKVTMQMVKKLPSRWSKSDHKMVRNSPPLKKEEKKKNARARAREDETEHQPDPTPASPMNGAGVVSGMTDEDYDQALRMFLSRGRSKGW